MPTYQYACTSCGERLEAVQKFSDDPLTECPACAGTLRKVFSAVGVVFKGSGFYKTDSRSRSGSKSGASSSSSSSSADASTSDSSAATKSGGSSEAAPAASGSGGEKKSDNTDKVA
jgi:putative FmdB family regulatory protein